MFKSCLLSLMVVGLLCAAAASSIAQDSQTNDQSTQEEAPPEHHRGHFDPQQMTERLTKQLDLTSDQQTKVLDVLKAQQSQMESLRSDTSISQQDRRQKMIEIRKSSDDQIRGTLNPDQQKKWDQMQARRRQWHEQGSQAAPPSSSQQ
jgi:periplasmic protein CpxP/Spy